MSDLAYFEYALVLPEERFLVEAQARNPATAELRGYTYRFRYSRRSRLEKQPTDLWRKACYFADRTPSIASVLQPNTSRLSDSPSAQGSTSHSDVDCGHSGRGSRHSIGHSSASCQDPRHITGPGAGVPFQPSPGEEQPGQ